MFVVFEGIDGSGKTTVSNRVAKRLRARGIAVEHVREGGEFASPLVSRMRAFGKDPRNLAMAPLTELLFYAARDAQLLAESIRPALAGDAVVFADRYLYSCEVLSHDGRGVPLAQVRPVLDAVADGVWPDLVVLMDVNPYVARARRKVAKIQKKAQREDLGPGSRKGLVGGIGAQHRLRAGYLRLAARDPDRWLVIDNADPASEHATLDAIVARIADAIAARASGASVPEAIASAERPARPRPAAPRDFAGAADAYYRALEVRAAREPQTAAYFLSGLEDERAWVMRERLADDAPHALAYGLRGVGGERAWAMRERLRDRAPYFVARSLDGLEVEGPRAEAMRAELADDQPDAVLATLDGNDDGAAWALRERFARTHPRQVVASLKRLDSERAWAVRARFAADHESAPPTLLSPLIQSVRGLDSERAWAMRRDYLDELPGPVLRSLMSLDSDEAWALRERFADRAPKIVMRTFDGLDHPRAWALRADRAVRVKEALDSLIGSDADQAWAIRERCRDVWPSTTVKSLGPLGLRDRGRALALALLAAYPDNISLLKHATRLVAWEAGDAAAR